MCDGQIRLPLMRFDGSQTWLQSHLAKQNEQPSAVLQSTLARWKMAKMKAVKLFY